MIGTTWIVQSMADHWECECNTLVAAVSVARACAKAGFSAVVLKRVTTEEGRFEPGNDLFIPAALGGSGDEGDCDNDDLEPAE